MRPKWPKITWTSCADPEALRVLGINPWITDFAAYNFWSRPAGLLSCLDLLRKSGAGIALMDCLEQTWQDMDWPTPRKDGRGHFPRTFLPTPEILEHVPRQFTRYGLPLKAVRKALSTLTPPPDVVMVTTIMTYWYPGAVTALRLARDLWPEAKIVLGGIYPTLCPDHAARLGLADLILQGPLESPRNWSRFWKVLGQTAPKLPGDSFSLALDLYSAPGFSLILGSRGCPFDCAYCASSALNPGFKQRCPRPVFEEFDAEVRRNVTDFAFYDDALLVNKNRWLVPLLRRISSLDHPVRLHTPNALHVRELDIGTCRLLKQSGLTTLRLGLETSDFETRHDAKLTYEQWQEGTSNLRQAGFTDEQLGAYILFGLPGQPPEEVERSIEFVKSFGIRPHLAAYSPIPGSRLFPEACKASPYPLGEEPLTHNNAIWPCVPGGFSWTRQARLKSVTGTI